MSTLLLVGAGALKAFSELKKGQIAKAQGKFTEQITIRNQQALERQRTAELEAADIESSRIARKEKIFLARQIAVAGKSGVGIAGATLSVLADAAAQFSLDRNLALRRGLIRGRELRERGKIQLAKGRFAFGLGKQAKKLSFVKAGASILGGASKSGIFD
ncbi:hypothetical protein LCGC14_1430020 [marine sediment metagenome]|uniref:Uncharacterized protein n=1 Tax=marine sediment metagenome TaxID=412755 RepID=A0A0F9MQP9_9ZZZZ